MKRILITLMILGLACTTTQAQSILRRLERAARTAAERTAERKVEEKVEKEVDKALDKALEEGEEKEQEEGRENKANRSTSRRAVQNQDLEFDDWDLEDEDREMIKRTGKSGSGQAPNPANPQNKKAQMEWAKSDFVAGDEIFFEDNLVGEQIGEFPSCWDIVEGNAEIVRLDGENAIMLLDDARLIPFMENQERYLPNVFTLEFDFYLHGWEDGFEETGEYPYSDYMLYMFNDKNGEWGDPTMEVLEFILDPRGRSIICYYNSGSYDRRDASVDRIDVQYGDWSHFALSFNKRALKIYINGTRIINLPNMAAPQRFMIRQGWGKPNTTFIKNVRLAKGAVPLYDRMMQDGKFISYGITFDTGKSIIKPESAGELNRIVQLLKENPSLRFSVEGHTDATGSASSNQKLSEDRAHAVVARLVELGIDGSRLSAKGLGQNNPVADNSSVEGRAKNRRVEFVKL